MSKKTQKRDDLDIKELEKKVKEYNYGWINGGRKWEKCISMIGEYINMKKIDGKEIVLAGILYKCFHLPSEEDRSRWSIQSEEENLEQAIGLIEDENKILNILYAYIQFTGRTEEWLISFFLDCDVSEQVQLMFIEKLFRERKTEWLLWALICSLDDWQPVFNSEKESTKEMLKRYINEANCPASLIFLNQLLTGGYSGFSPEA